MMPFICESVEIFQPNGKMKFTAKYLDRFASNYNLCFMKVGSFWANQWVQTISQFVSHHPFPLTTTLIIIVILSTLFPRTWHAINEASNRFEKKYKILLVTIAAIVILATIAFLLYFLLVTAPKHYPTGS
jgi:uncharacterized membrane protein